MSCWRTPLRAATAAMTVVLLPALFIHAVIEISYQPEHPAGQVQVFVPEFHPPQGSSRIVSKAMRLLTPDVRACAAFRCARNMTLLVRNVNGAWTWPLNVDGTGPDPAMKLGATGSVPAIQAHSHNAMNLV